MFASYAFVSICFLYFISWFSFDSVRIFKYPVRSQGGFHGKKRIQHKIGLLRFGRNTKWMRVYLLRRIVHWFAIGRCQGGEWCVEKEALGLSADWVQANRNQSRCSRQPLGSAKSFDAIKGICPSSKCDILTFYNSRLHGFVVVVVFF